MLKSELVISLLLAIATAAVFWQVGNNGFINYDDPSYVFENPHVVSGLSLENARWAFTAIHMSNWHPLTWLSHMMDCQLYGLNPRGHHFTNLVLHILTTVLLFLFLNRTTGVPWRSAFVAALFALGGGVIGGSGASRSHHGRRHKQGTTCWAALTANEVAVT